MIATELRHEHDIEVIPPCCNGYDQEGIISCGCQGRYEVLCNAPFCPGILDFEFFDAVASVTETVS